MLMKERGKEEKNKTIRTNFLKGMKKHFVGSEILTAVVMKSSVFWDITPCSPLKFVWRSADYTALYPRRQNSS
jgi:hypothetical protein